MYTAAIPLPAEQTIFASFEAGHSIVDCFDCCFGLDVFWFVKFYKQTRIHSSEVVTHVFWSTVNKEDYLSLTDLIFCRNTSFPELLQNMHCLNSASSLDGLTKTKRKFRWQNLQWLSQLWYILGVQRTINPLCTVLWDATDSSHYFFSLSVSIRNSFN